MKKLAYYSLGVALAVIPFAFILWAMVALSYTSLSNGAWAASCVGLFGAFIIYLLIMFED